MHAPLPGNSEPPTPCLKADANDSSQPASAGLVLLRHRGFLRESLHGKPVFAFNRMERSKAQYPAAMALKKSLIGTASRTRYPLNEDSRLITEEYEHVRDVVTSTSILRTGPAEARGQFHLEIQGPGLSNV